MMEPYFQKKFWQKELWRKSIHLFGLFLIPILLWKREVFVLLVLAALLLYLTVEWLERRGRSLPFLTALTLKSKRGTEQGHLSRGAVCLALSGILTPYLFGAETAALGLTQVFVADAAATLVGLKFGKKKLPYAKGKSWAGSMAYLLSATLAGLIFIPWKEAVFLACLGTLVESLPAREWDNLTIPLFIGLARTIL